jgi:hypothetical protein
MVAKRHARWARLILIPHRVIQKRVTSINIQKVKKKKKTEQEELDEDYDQNKLIEKINTTIPFSPPTQNTSMEALNASRYIVSVVLVLLIGALVGILATVSHHCHHRHLHQLSNETIIRDHPRYHRHHRHHHHYHLHHHYHHHHYHYYYHHYHHRHRRQHREDQPASQQRQLLLDDHRHPKSMLTVSAGMEVGGGGLGGGLEGGTTGAVSSNGMRQESMVVAAARDRAIRSSSVRQDLVLDLPPRLQLPDGEERPYSAHTGLHLRDPEQESEIYQKCVRPPPNRTIFDSESPPPYRSQSGLLDTPDRIIRCHSAGSSLLRVFRKFPSSTGNSTLAVVVPPTRRPTLSSYSESSGNLSNLSSLTVVPCETDETSNQHHRENV